MEEAVTLLPSVSAKTKRGLDSTLKRLWQGVLKPYCVRGGGGKVGVSGDVGRCTGENGLMCFLSSLGGGIRKGLMENQDFHPYPVVMRTYLPVTPPHLPCSVTGDPAESRNCHLPCWHQHRPSWGPGKPLPGWEEPAINPESHNTTPKCPGFIWKVLYWEPGRSEIECKEMNTYQYQDDRDGGITWLRF